jgi:hypothetical protein
VPNGSVDTTASDPDAAHGTSVYVDGSSSAPKYLSPKRPAVETAGLADVFPYYAGFSAEWAISEVRRHASNGGDMVVLDPWNGSGTTTLAAQVNNIRSVGVDLNPAANVVARFRCNTEPSVRPLKPPKHGPATGLMPDEPLLNWFTSSTASRIRDWRNLIKSSPGDVATLGQLALFRAVRKLTVRFEGSNPTWVKAAPVDSDAVSLHSDALDFMVESEQGWLSQRLSEAYRGPISSSILTGSSSALPVKDSSIELILTSPPYLTRIDYGVAYSRELAVMGIDVRRDRKLRSSLMGTTLIRNLPISRTFGEVANQLLVNIAGHASKASGGYYLKQATQYLDDLLAGFVELTRVAKSGARLCLVVQDSYYKDVPVPLAAICANEAQRLGWSELSRMQFPVKRSITSLNKAARAYTKGEVVETVIVLEFDREHSVR